MSQAARRQLAKARDVQIRSGAVTLAGDLDLPAHAEGVVLFAHGSGSSRHSSRNQLVARTIRDARVGAGGRARNQVVSNAFEQRET